MPGLLNSVTNAGLESLLLFLVVIVLSAARIALSGGSSASSVTSARWGIAAYLAALAVALASIWPETAATWTLLAYVAAACVLLPRPLGWLALTGVAGLHVLLTWISRVKAGLTGLPVTVLDIRIALANPAGLWDALGLPHWTRYVATAVIVLGCFGVLVAALLAGVDSGSLGCEAVVDRVSSELASPARPLGSLIPREDTG